MNLLTNAVISTPLSPFFVRFTLFNGYLQVKELFNDNDQADVIEELRQQHKKDLAKVVDIVLSHHGVKRKNQFILRLMGALVYRNLAAYRDQLIRFAELNCSLYSEVSRINARIRKSYRRKRAIFSRMITCLFYELPHLYQYQDNFLSVRAVLFGKSFIERNNCSLLSWDRLGENASIQFSLSKFIEFIE